MKKTRLTVVISDLGFGGAQHMVYEQLKYTNCDRYDVSIVVLGTRNQTPLEKQLEARFPVTYIGHEGRVTPITIYKVLHAIQKTNADIAHGHIGGVGFAAMWASVFRKPLIITVHTEPQKAFSTKVEKQVRNALKAGRTKLVAVSEDNAKKVKEYFGLNAQQCVCVNNGIDLERFSRRAHDGFTVIHVGRQDANKNQGALIRCFAKLHEKFQNTKLLLLGDGELHQSLKEQVKALGLEDAVTLTGNVSNTEDYYAVSDLYVQCSYREAMPLSVLEAMAAGLPIISTDVGGLRDVVEDNGILVPAGDEEALYQAMEQVYTQTPEETLAMCRASDRIVQNYSSQAMARAYEDIYQNMH